MYQVSQEYITKAFNISKKRRAVYALLDDVPFTENELVANSLKYTWQCVGGAEINLGGVFIGQLFLTFTHAFTSQVSRGTWKGKRINLSIGLELGIEPETHEPIIEYVPIGIYTIEDAVHTENGVEITAYDDMRKFDKKLNLTSSSGSLYSLLTFACNKCHVELGMTREEVEALPNGQEVFSIYPDNDMSTYRDLVSWIAVTMGGYSTINRSGQLVLRGWQADPVFSMGINDRFARGSWSDFHTYYTGLSVTNIADQTTSYYHKVPDNGLTMNISSNPLLQFGLDETKTRQRMAVLNALSNFDYVPFKCSAFADVFFDLGDVITFTDGLAGHSSKCCIMRIDFTFSKGITFQGFGKNPALFGAQSKTDKNLAGLNKQNQSNEMQFIKYVNADAEVPDDYGRRVLAGSGINMPLKYLLHEFTLTANKDTNVEVFTRVQPYRTTTDGMYAWKNEYYSVYHGFLYEVDGVEEHETMFYTDRMQGTDWSTATGRMRSAGAKDSIEDNFTLMNMAAGENKTLKVYYIAFCVTEGSHLSGETFFRDYFYNAGDIEIVIKGQGLAKEPAWDGYIRADDIISRQKYGFVAVRNFVEDAEVTIITPFLPEATDAIQKQNYAGLGLPDITETVTITMHRPKRNIISIRNGNLANISKTENIITV